MQMNVDISGKTRLISMIGSPVSHSASPATHTLAFQKQGIDAVFLVFDVQNEALGDIVAAFRQMEGWDGSNVTMPCKQAIIPYLDGLSEAAELMGAVNVISKTDGKVIGYNTDGEGFINNLKKHGVKVAGATITLLGLGGAGSAILGQAALDGAEKVNVFVRRGGASWQRAAGLLERVTAKTGCEVSLHALEDAEDLRACVAASDILANATNVGMGEGRTDTPVPADFIKPGMAVADVIYAPPETQLLADAAARGCITLNGMGMLNEQAVAAERVWYGVDMPIDEVASEVAAG